MYEFAAQFVLKYERKLKEKQSKKEQILEYNSEALRSNVGKGEIKKENSIVSQDSVSVRKGRSPKN